MYLKSMSASSMFASSSSSSNQRNRYIYCHCGQKMFIFTSWTTKNPGRRFVRCPNVKTQFCTTFSFIDEELPNEYYKELVYDLGSKRKQLANMKSGFGDEEDETKVKLLHALEELTKSKSRLKFFEKAAYVLFGVGVMFCIVIVIGLIVMY